MLLYSIHVTYVCGKNELLGQALSKHIADYRLCRPRQNGTSKGGLCSEDLLSFPRGSSREDGGLSRKKSPSIESRVSPSSKLGVALLAQIKKGFLERTAIAR